MATQISNSRGTILIAASGIAVVTTFATAVTVFDLNRYFLSSITAGAGPTLNVAIWGMVALAWALLGSVIVGELRHGGSARPAASVQAPRQVLTAKPLGRRFWYPFGVLLVVAPLLGHALFSAFPALLDVFPAVMVGIIFVTLAGFVLKWSSCVSV